MLQTSQLGKTQLASSVKKKMDYIVAVLDHEFPENSEQRTKLLNLFAEDMAMALGVFVRTTRVKEILEGSVIIMFEFEHPTIASTKLEKEYLEQVEDLNSTLHGGTVTCTLDSERTLAMMSTRTQVLA